MSKNLVIVESPAKAKTISSYLGDEFIIKSCNGHIRDLSKKDNAIDVENNFFPTYEVPAEKKEIVNDLKKISGKAQTVWLATDEDREGEAISWHLCEALGLDIQKTKRIVFHEITKPAILKAIENPRSINVDLVNAQQARRILDRLVGFELSPLLWKKIKPALSAGRVQSVAVRLIVEKEKEIKEFQSAPFYKITANFDIPVSENSEKVTTLKAELPGKFQSETEAENFLKKCIGADFTISSLETKPAKKSPSPPFITSTLQQEASRKLGYSVAKTMMVAQKLYESGKITYMRTDSVTLSETALENSKNEIENLYGAAYSQSRQFTTKSKGAQEAHEAIRPTYFNQQTVSGTYDETRLYDLIWKRAIASQMSDARLEKTSIGISISTTNEKLNASGEVIKFDGFLRVYMESTDDELDDKESESSDMLPPLKIDQKLNLNKMIAMQRFTHPPARYTEASLVRKLEELGIGRPSTYAPTISTIQKRGYVEKGISEGTERMYTVLQLTKNQITKLQQKEKTGAEKGKLIPTDIGIVVNDFLVENFKEILEYQFTATVEKEFDEISLGNKVWTKMIADFYTPFHKNVVHTLENSGRVSGERELGIEPKSGKKIIARIGRFGPMIQIGETESDEKPRFAGLRQDQRIDSITLEQALDLLKLPRTLGEFEGEELVVNIGKFGPYVKHDKKFYSIKGEDPYSILQEKAIDVILTKRKLDAEKLIKSFDDNENVKVLNGRYGPYIVCGDQNVRIPKEKDPKTLTLEECLKLASDAPKTTRKRRFFKKK